MTRSYVLMKLEEVSRYLVYWIYDRSVDK